MSTTPQTKINQLLQALPPGAVYLSSWMKLKNISNDLQHRYIKSAWLTPIGTGAMIRTGDTPTLYGAMYSLNTQADKHLTIGAMSALEIHGYSHYLPMGKPTVSLSAPQKSIYRFGSENTTGALHSGCLPPRYSAPTLESLPPDKGFSSCRSLPRNGRLWSVCTSHRNITTLPTSIM